MPNFKYINSIPNAPDNPSNSQSNLRINCESIESLVSVDLYGFNDDNGGTHQKASFPIPTSPVPTATGLEGVLYAITGSNSESELVFKNKDATYQLTGSVTESGGERTIVTPFGLIFKMGVATVASGGTFNYSVPFPTNGYGVVITLRLAGGSGVTSAVQVSGVDGKTGFVPVYGVLGAQAMYFYAWGD